MRIILGLCVLYSSIQIIHMYIPPPPPSTDSTISDRYLEGLRKKRNANNNYLDNLSPVRKQREKFIKRLVPTTKETNNTSPFFMNATFVINQISSNELVNREKKSNSKVSSSGNFMLQNVEQYNFTKIGGYRLIKNELLQMLDMVKNPDNYTLYNVRLPKGVLLYGPPGNGKTLLARCFAGESQLPIIVTSGSEFQEKYVGTGPARIRELFEFARDNTPCMVFIDELDAVARKRGTDGETAQAERDSTLNQLLVELDGFSSFLDKKILVMASTNRIDILDSALLRPGRIDKKIQVPLPDRETRKEIVDIHIERKPIDVDKEYLVSELTDGMSGAEIEHLLNEATLQGIRNNVLPVKVEQLENVRESLLIGNEAQQIQPVSGEIALRVAVHEMGHVLVAINCIYHDNPKKVTIRGSNKVLGYTLFPPNQEKLMTLGSLGDKIKVLLGGRIAEEIIFGPESISTGAADDLQKCQQLAHDMILLYGMGTQLVYPRMSDKSKGEIDNAVFDVVSKKYYEAKAILEQHKHLLTKMGAELVKRESLTLDEIIQLIKKNDNY